MTLLFRRLAVLLPVIGLLAAISAGANISIPDFEIEIGSVVCRELEVEAAQEDLLAYSGFQFDLFLPEGLILEDTALDTQLSESGLILNISDYGDGVFRILTFTNEAGLDSSSLMRFSFRACEDALPGISQIKLCNVVFSSPDGKDIYYNDSETKVTFKQKEPDGPGKPFGSAETPLQLLRKGDGKSHTFVCMMPLSNQQLTQSGYNFVYGYDTTGGESRMLEDTPLRYCHTTAEIFDDATLDFWVFAYYTDSEGSLCVSDRRHLDGSIDDNFDPADYLGKSTKADSDAEITGVFTTDGRKVSDDINKLAKGIYVVRTATGSFKIMK